MRGTVGEGPITSKLLGLGVVLFDRMRLLGEAKLSRFPCCSSQHAHWKGWEQVHCAFYILYSSQFSAASERSIVTIKPSRHMHYLDMESGHHKEAIGPLF
jgi:hypothetical protein